MGLGVGLELGVRVGVRLRVGLGLGLGLGLERAVRGCYYPGGYLVIGLAARVTQGHGAWLGLGSRCLVRVRVTVPG